MKKLLITTVLTAGFAAGLFAQGITIENDQGNAGALGATSGGLFYINGVAAVDNISITVLGGLTSGSLSPLITLTPADFFLPAGTPGQYIDYLGNVVGPASLGDNQPFFVELLAWTGSAASFGAAQSDPGAFLADSGVFSNPSGGGGSPPTTPATLTGMPSMNLVAVPEPATFALAGLGLASLLIFRRRK
jgi:hypothetical protein